MADITIEFFEHYNGSNSFCHILKPIFEPKHHRTVPGGANSARPTMAQPMTQRASPMKRAHKTLVKMQGPMPMMAPGTQKPFLAAINGMAQKNWKQKCFATQK